MISLPAISIPRRAAARLTAGAGYTIIEVLMAMTVLAIGGAGVITMQKTSVTGNLDARKADVANGIARTWVERLRRDAMQWTLPTGAGTASNFANTVFLNGNVQPAGAGIWFLPKTVLSPSDGTTTMSAGDDILGRDVPDLTTALFCVNLRLTWLDTTGAPPGGDLIRADIRVLWPIGIAVAPPAGGFCNATTAALADPNSVNAPSLTYHAIYLTTSVAENAVP
ncbi:MAG: type IV pilus modification PilV family protein [Polyangiaceae bacterium]